MSTIHALQAMRARLFKQIERNQWLEQKNKTLLAEISELERRRRLEDSGIVRAIKWIESRFTSHHF